MSSVAASERIAAIAAGFEALTAELLDGLDGSAGGEHADC